MLILLARTVSLCLGEITQMNHRCAGISLNINITESIISRPPSLLGLL